MNRLWILAALVTLATLTHGYKKGAPKESCDDMKPEHGVDPKTTKFPYSITLSKSKIPPGGKVTVTLSGSDSETFKGYFVQARVGNKAVGHFDEAPGAGFVDCHGSVKSGITHSSNSEKKTVSLTWNAPKRLSEKVVFWVTMVKDGATFWVGKKSSQLEVRN
ncbi:putative defense protein 1 [Ischnura elegans]|uniref:putative defense protein 1 n=1 Tax=Ischnura elegans TaxID=197161 RepID=UPI001ED88DB3|nr:putative defense protein 1 [Ischnura elegans]